jgi:hypothetical protein
MHIYPLLGLVCYHSMFPVGAFLTVFRNDWVSGKLLNLVQQIAQTTVPAITEFHSLTNHPSSSNSQGDWANPPPVFSTAAALLLGSRK